MKILNFMDKNLELVGRLSLYLSAVLVGVILTGIVYGALGRMFLDHPPIWPSSVTAYALLLATLFAAPKLMRDNQHVVVDALLRAVSPKVSNILVCCAAIISTTSCAVMAYIAGGVTLEAIEKDYQDVREISIHLAYLTGPISFCFGMLALESLRRVILVIGGLSK